MLKVILKYMITHACYLDQTARAVAGCPGARRIHRHTIHNSRERMGKASCASVCVCGPCEGGSGEHGTRPSHAMWRSRPTVPLPVQLVAGSPLEWCDRNLSRHPTRAAMARAAQLATGFRSVDEHQPRALSSSCAAATAHPSCRCACRSRSCPSCEARAPLSPFKPTCRAPARVGSSAACDPNPQAL